MTARCPCGGTLDDVALDLWLHTPAGAIPLAAVPRLTCGSCTREAYTVATLQRIEAVMRAGWAEDDLSGGTADA